MATTGLALALKASYVLCKLDVYPVIEGYKCRLKNE